MPGGMPVHIAAHGTVASDGQVVHGGEHETMRVSFAPRECSAFRLLSPGVLPVPSLRSRSVVSRQNDELSVALRPGVVALKTQAVARTFLEADEQKRYTRKLAVSKVCLRSLRQTADADSTGLPAESARCCIESQAR